MSKSMGLTYADLRLTNLFTGAAVDERVLVDTGAMPLCITAAVARALGFDTEETSTGNVTVADGRRIKVPCVAPIRIEFANRKYITEAFVFGDESLLGVVPMEMLDVIVHPATNQLIVNPAHPDGPVYPVKAAAFTTPVPRAA